MARPVYHRLPDTPETQLARELTDMQSQVRRREGPGRRRGCSDRNVPGLITCRRSSEVTVCELCDDEDSGLAQMASHHFLWS